MATFNKADEYFHKKYSESLSVLEKYKLKATIKHTNHDVVIRLTYLEGGEYQKFNLEYSKCVSTTNFTLKSIDELAAVFFNALPRLYPMLELRNSYIQINGKEIDSDLLKSLIDAYHSIEPVDSEFDVGFDGHWVKWDYSRDCFMEFSSQALKALEAMYTEACMAQLQLVSGNDLDSLATDLKLGNAAVVLQSGSSYGKVSRYNPLFQEQFEDELAELATYGLKATVRKTEVKHLIWLTYGSKPFSLQFLEQVELEDMSEDALEEVGAKFCNALEVLYPMLQARKRYMALSGKDLDFDSVASLHEAWDDFEEEEDEDGEDRVPVGDSWFLAVVDEGFCRYQLELMTKMYVAGATMHSKYSALETFLVMPSEPCTINSDEKAYCLDESHIVMSVQTGSRGLAYELYAGFASSTDFEVAGVTVDSDFEISLPPTFWNTVKVIWAQLEKRFGISKELFDVHMQMSTGPLEALKSVYHHVRTKPMTDAMVVAAGFDFNDASEPVGDAFPAESNATVFAIRA